MRAFTSHDTALTYWREHFPLDSEPGKPARISGVEKCAYKKADVLECVPETFRVPDKPIDVLLFNAGDRRWSKQVSCYVWSTFVPKGAFYRVGSMYVSSPEFTFLQMASKLTLNQLIALGCELCGTYVLLPQGNTHPSAIDEFPTRIAPLTNVESLRKFAEKATKAHGRAKALRALRYVVEGSHSPMETMVYMLLCLPPKLGGYGIPKPDMNAKIPLDEEGQAIARRGSCYGDLCWPEALLDVEYHGEVHVGASQMKSDVGRELGIEHMGWRVITITSAQVLDADRFEVVAREVAACLKKRLYPQVLGATGERSSLRGELEQWMFSRE